LSASKARIVGLGKRRYDSIDAPLKLDDNANPAMRSARTEQPLAARPDVGFAISWMFDGQQNVWEGTGHIGVPPQDMIPSCQPEFNDSTV